tara:strand:- start:16767 stop:19844 length:3078 start_codon:yes stop_codon:yes gene_type:complete
MTTNNFLNKLLDLTTDKKENTKESFFKKADDDILEFDPSKPMDAQQPEVQGLLSGMPPKTPQAPGGLDQLPAEQRLYLTPDGKIPNTDSTPQDLKLHVYVGQKQGQYVDKRLIQKKHAAIYEQHHAKTSDSVRYGGVIIDPETGKVLMRQPSSESYGNRWTLAKGGADEGETPQQAALREVEEETGMKCKITKEIPGHYQSNGDNHKFFVMEVETTSEDFGDETKSVKWMSPDEAYKTLDDIDNESAKRDKDAIAAGIYEHNEEKKTAGAFAKMMEHAKTAAINESEAFEYALDGFAQDGKFPEDFGTNPKYQKAFDNLAWHVSHPNDYDGNLKKLSGQVMKKLDEKYGLTDNTYIDMLSDLHSTFMGGWGNSALSNNYASNLVNHRLSKMFNLGDSYKFGSVVPPSVDSSGKQCYRSNEDKKTYIEAYDNWKAGNLELNTEGTKAYHVKLSDGEFINFDVKKEFSAPSKLGKDEKTYNSWDFRYKRDKKILEKENANSWQSKLENAAEAQGKKIIGELYDNMTEEQKKNFQNEDGSPMSELDAGNKLTDMYIEHAKEFNKQILDQVYPNTSHIFVGRKTTKAREIGGDFGPTGTGTSSAVLDPLLKEAEAKGEGLKVNLHTAALGGYSTNPNAWNGKYAIIKKVNKRDVFMMPSISSTGHDSEFEIIVMNNPESEARTVSLDGKVWGGEWKLGGDTNGLHPENMFGKTQSSGITNPNKDYHETLKPVKQSDEVPAGKLGTNTGGTYTDERGGHYYVKNDYDDKHASEQLANTIYKKLGFNVPETELVNWKDKTALKSKWLSGGKYHQGTQALLNRADLKDGFLVDAVLANRDVVGAGVEKPYGNILEHEGKFYRLDQGGALEHNGLSGKKNDFHDWKNEHLSELDGFLDKEINPTTAHVFGGGEGMSNTWQKATDKLIQMKDSVIEDLVTDSGIAPQSKSKMIDTLKRRRDNALEWVIKNHDVEYNSLEEIKNSTSLLKASIEEDEGIHLYLDEPQSDRYAWTDEEKADNDAQWKELNEYYKTE